MTRTIKHPLKAFRDANALTQTDAAKLVGITQAHWSRMESGHAHARPRIARRIANLTGISIEALLDFRDNESGTAA